MTLLQIYCWVCQQKNHKRRSSVNLGGQDIFARKYMHEKLTKIPNFTWYLPEKLTKFRNFTRGMPEKNNKMPEFYMIIARKIFFLIFLGRGATAPPLTPSPRLLRLWKEPLKSVNILWRYGQEYGVFLLIHGVYVSRNNFRHIYSWLWLQRRHSVGFTSGRWWWATCVCGHALRHATAMHVVHTDPSLRCHNIYDEDLFTTFKQTWGDCDDE